MDKETNTTEVKKVKSKLKNKPIENKIKFIFENKLETIEEDISTTPPEAPSKKIRGFVRVNKIQYFDGHNPLKRLSRKRIN